MCNALPIPGVYMRGKRETFKVLHGNQSWLVSIIIFIHLNNEFECHVLDYMKFFWHHVNNLENTLIYK